MEGQPLIQHGGINAKLVSALQVHGKVVAPTLGDVVHPVVVVEDISRDSWFSEIIDRMGALALDLTAAAGQVPEAQLFNPATSGVLAIVDFVMLSSSGTSPFYISIKSAALPTAVAPGTPWRDTRLSGTFGLIPKTDVPAALNAPFPSYVGSVGTVATQVVQTDIILAPGFGVNVGLTLPASTLHVGFKWRERHIV